MDDESRIARQRAKEEMRPAVERAVAGAQDELASARGLRLTRLQVIRRMIGNVQLAVYYYERMNPVTTPDEHAELQAGAEVIVEVLHEMEAKERN